MTRHYATTVHAPLLPQLRVLYASMQRHCAPFVLHVLAEGEEVARVADCLPDVEVTNVEDFLAQHPEWDPGRLPGPPRNGNELACAWRWRFVADLLARTGEPVTLVDADIAFWSSPEPVFSEISGAKRSGVALSLHGFARAAEGRRGVTQESHGKFGRHNGGVSYWADPRAAGAMAALAFECSHATDHLWPDGRTTWGDQGALQLIKEEFGAHEIRHPGVNLAPWNYHCRRIEESAAGITVDGRSVVLVHYQSLKLRGGNIVQLGDSNYEITEEIARMLYAPYLKELRKWNSSTSLGSDSDI